MGYYDYYDYYGYSNHSGLGVIAVLSVLAFLAAVVGTVLIMVLVTPEKRRAKLPKALQVFADICNFKGLLLEYIVRAIYIFSTILTVISGVFTILSAPFTGSVGGFFAAVFGGLLSIVMGVILIRVIFEFAMMFILLVKNVIQINNKMPGKADDPLKLDLAAVKEAPKAAAPAAPAAEPKMVFCSQCGTQYDESKGGCPNGCKE